ncbi:MAG: MBL fold metallo-hydrolase [Bacillota bacterium]|nr:MBL fold metallo-hydrolase [Bacillota bacterium]
MSIISVILFIISILGVLAVSAYLNRIQYKIKVFEKAIMTVSNNTSSLSNNSGTSLEEPALISVKAIHSGDIKLPLSNPLNLKHPACSGIQNKNVVIPIFAYLIHHIKYGYFLIDSGCEDSYVNDPYGPMKGLILQSVMPKTILDPGQAIDRQLIAEKNNIKGVFFTHLHFDHTSGIKALPGDILYIAGEGEESISIKWLIEPNHFNRQAVVYLFDFNSEEAFDHPIGKAVDVFGDNTLLAISTPGHSKGHVSYIVNTKDHPVLISGDAVILNKSIELGAGPGTSSKNIKSAQKTFEKIREYLKNNPETELWPGHDFSISRLQL